MVNGHVKSVVVLYYGRKSPSSEGWDYQHQEGNVTKWICIYMPRYRYVYDCPTVKERLPFIYVI